jgi:hypothetical protein
MRANQSLSCGICGSFTLTRDGKRTTWYYEPRSDYYCARHWEQAFAEDTRSNAGNAHWQAVTRPLLEMTRIIVQREALASAYV